MIFFLQNKFITFGFKKGEKERIIKQAVSETNTLLREKEKIEFIKVRGERLEVRGKKKDQAYA